MIPKNNNNNNYNIDKFIDMLLGLALQKKCFLVDTSLRWVIDNKNGSDVLSRLL